MTDFESKEDDVWSTNFSLESNKELESKDFRTLRCCSASFATLLTVSAVSRISSSACRIVS